ncbi:hypothetical protein EVAR_37214_1 [Eumeta japonica]|uniref:Uncharacterized protein n=1 Tax=Eumeta variegata TaxID=151549 RepID=A0A4C1Y6J2_EUMVA|nr:hypothetical protein EVAR_37214_1 [Eumeta japonica]
MPCREGDEDNGTAGPGWEEVLTWLVEVGAEGEGDGEGSEGEVGRGTARLSWSVRTSTASATTAEPPHEHRLNTRLDIEKDDIQAVLPISKQTNLRPARVGSRRPPWTLASPEEYSASPFSWLGVGYLMEGLSEWKWGDGEGMGSRNTLHKTQQRKLSFHVSSLSGCYLTSQVGLQPR